LPGAADAIYRYYFLAFKRVPTDRCSLLQIKEKKHGKTHEHSFSKKSAGVKEKAFATLASTKETQKKVRSKSFTTKIFLLAKHMLKKASDKNSLQPQLDKHLT